MQHINWLTARAQSTPRKLALVVGEQTLTYDELHRLTMRFAGWLSACGVSYGTRVVVLMQNSAEYIGLIHAVAGIGATLVPLNTRLTVAELRWQVERVGCSHVVCDAVHVDAATELALDVSLLPLADGMQFEGDALELKPLEDDAVQVIVFTSGTAGAPKAAQITSGNFYASAIASAFRLGTLPNDRWLCVLPLYHVGGLSIVFRCCLYGTTVILQSGFDAVRVYEGLHKHGVTLVSLVPTMLYRMLGLQHPNPFPSSLRLVLLGGAAASVDLIDRCNAKDIPVATTYGLTEASSQVATMLPQDVRRKPGSVGMALFGTRVRVVNADGQAMPPNEYGEVVVSGETVMPGYFDDRAATERVLRNGELHTGDIGYLDDDGDLWLVQRRSDLIVTGGENVYPVEVEAALREQPAVRDVTVVGVDDSEWGQRVAAMLVTTGDDRVDATVLDTHCRERLAGYKCPRFYHFVDAMPQTASGKIHRQRIREIMSGVADTYAK